MKVETTECVCICVYCLLLNYNTTRFSNLKFSVTLNYIWAGRWKRHSFSSRNTKFLQNNLKPYATQKTLKKGKAVPLQARSGPEGSRKLRFPDFMTTAQEGGKVVSLMHRPNLPLENPPGTHFC